MKNGIFKSFFLILISLSLQGCATLLDFEDEASIDPADYDRGYAPEMQACEGRFCDTDEEGRQPASVSDSGAPLDYDKRRVNRAIEARDVVIGMTRQQVMSSWGEPAMREVAGDGRRGHERWTYGSRYSLSGSRVLIFENGKVAGWHR